MSRPVQGLGAGEAPDDYDTYLRDKYGGSGQTSPAPPASPQQQAQGGKPFGKPMPTMPKMPEMPKYQRTAGNFSGFSGKAVPDVGSGPGLSGQRSGEGFTASGYQPPSPIPRMPSNPQGFSQSFNPADYGLPKSPHQASSVHSQPGNAQGRNAFFDPTTQGSTSQPGSARGRNTYFEPAGFGLAARDPGSGYDRVREPGQQSPDLSGYGLAPPTPPQQPASPQHQPATDPFVQATLSQINTGANAQRRPASSTTFPSAGQSEQSSRTDFEQSVMEPTVPLDSSSSAFQQPQSEPDHTPAQQQREETPYMFQPPAQSLSRYSTSESTAPQNEPVRPTRSVLSDDAPNAASARSTYNDDAASTAVQLSEASFDGDDAAQQAFLNSTTAYGSPASASRLSTSASRRPAYGSSSVQPVQEGYESGREPEREYEPASQTGPASQGQLGGDAYSGPDSEAYGPRLGRTVHESEQSTYDTGRAARDQEVLAEQLSPADADHSRLSDQAPAYDQNERSALTASEPGTAPGSSSADQFASSGAGQPAVTQQVQAHLKNLLGSSASGTSHPTSSPEGAEGTGVASADEMAAPQSDSRRSKQPIREDDYSSSAQEYPASSAGTAKPSGTSTDVFASQAEPPSRFAEALSPLTQVTTGGTPGKYSGNEYDRTAAPQSSTTAGLGAAVAEKASHLYNSLPGTTQSRATGQADAYQQGDSSDRAFDGESQPGTADFRNQGSVQQPQSSYMSGNQAEPPSKFAEALEPLTAPGAGPAPPQSSSMGGIGAAVTMTASQLYNSLPSSGLGSTGGQSQQGDVSQQPGRPDATSAGYSGQHDTAPDFDSVTKSETETTSSSQSGGPSPFKEALAPIAATDNRTTGPQSSSMGGIGAAVTEKASQLYNSLPSSGLGGTGPKSQQGDMSQQPIQRDTASAGHSDQRNTAPGSGSVNSETGTTSGLQSGGPSPFAEALAPIATPDTRTATPQSSSTVGISAVVADKASQLYNSLPAAVQGSTPASQDRTASADTGSGYAQEGYAGSTSDRRIAGDPDGSVQETAYPANTTQDSSLLGRAVAAVSAAGATAGALQRQYAPAALGGTPADSAGDTTASTGSYGNQAPAEGLSSSAGASTVASNRDAIATRQGDAADEEADRRISFARDVPETPMGQSRECSSPADDSAIGATAADRTDGSPFPGFGTAGSTSADVGPSSSVADVEPGTAGGSHDAAGTTQEEQSANPSGATEMDRVPSSTLAVIGSKFGVKLNKTSRSSTPRAGDSFKSSASAEGFSPSRGYPRDEAPAEAAVGGNAASVAPAAAAVAAGASDADAGRFSAEQEPASTGLAGRAAAAFSSAGKAAGDLQSKYAPAALGGSGADAVYDKPSRSGAGVGADPYPGEVQGLDPAKGTPSDAPASEAATGGDAGRIAGIAAGVAAGENEDSAARGMLRDQPPATRSQATVEDEATPASSSGGVLGLGSSTVAAIGSRFGVTLNRTPGASGTTTPKDTGEYGGLRGRSSAAGFSADQDAASPKDSVVARAAAALSAAGASAGALQRQYAPTALGGAPADSAGGLSAGAGSYANERSAADPDSTQGTFQEVPASETAKGGNASNVASGVAGGSSASGDGLQEANFKGGPEAASGAGRSPNPSSTAADRSGQPLVSSADSGTTGQDSSLLGKAAAAVSAAGATAGALQRQYAPAALGGTPSDSVANPSAPVGSYGKEQGYDTGEGIFSNQPSGVAQERPLSDLPKGGVVSPTSNRAQDLPPSETAKGGASAGLQLDGAAGVKQDPTTVAYGQGRNVPASQADLGTRDSVDAKFGALNFGQASTAQPAAGSYEPSSTNDKDGGGGSSTLRGIDDGVDSSRSVNGSTAAQGTADKSQGPDFRQEDRAGAGMSGADSAADGEDRVAATQAQLPGMDTRRSVENYNPQRGYPLDSPPNEAAVGGTAAALAHFAADKSVQDAAISRPSTLGETSERIIEAAKSLTRKYAPKSLGGVDAGYEESKARAGAGANADASEPEGSVQGMSPQPGYPRDAPASQAPLGGLGAGIASVAAAVATGGSEDAAVKQWEQEGTRLSPNDVDSLVAAAGGDDASLRALADSASGTSANMGPSDSIATGIAQPASTSRAPARQPATVDQSEAATFVDQANAALGAAQTKLHDMGFVTKPGPRGSAKGHYLGDRTVSDLSARLQNREQNNPVIVAGVGLVLISLFVKVPLWMWIALLSITGALYVIVQLFDGTKPKQD